MLFIAASLLVPTALVVHEPRNWLELALLFRAEPGWHGYWKNPGDAGLGMTLEWDLPDGWSAGEPLYPVPHMLVQQAGE